MDRIYNYSGWKYDMYLLYIKYSPSPTGSGWIWHGQKNKKVFHQDEFVSSETKNPGGILVFWVLEQVWLSRALWGLDPQSSLIVMLGGRELGRVTSQLQEVLLAGSLGTPQSSISLSLETEKAPGEQNIAWAYSKFRLYIYPINKDFFPCPLRER